MDASWQQDGPYRREDGANGEGFRSGQVQPEILPPDDPRGPNERPYEQAYYPPQQPQPGYAPQPSRPRRRNTWAFAPATYILVGINCVVFLLMLLSGVSILSPTSRQLVDFGANFGPYVLLGDQWWRLISAMFVHVGIIHLATNMWCLWNLGLLGEPLLGPFGVFATYLLTGLAGNILSVAVHPGINGDGIVGAGASGAVFGLAGVLIILLKSPLLPLPKVELKRLRGSVIQFAILNFAIGLYTAFGHTSIQIDNMAHLGGFLSGLALGLPMVPKIGAPKSTFVSRRLLATGGMFFLLLLICFGLHSFWRQ
ncbi:rhomboid family intramembrane serine protease [Silvibacterium acidisoli]|uniref:rhomboid family intramembrane serine protease n=1 Tax=Acidobacteriaceae bacterium ZG23-2 TaxID=2883246 RepID=UPI00406C3416